jgi:2-methylisocitrate lyase-like PEP mutase family enzyme
MLRFHGEPDGRATRATLRPTGASSPRTMRALLLPLAAATISLPEGRMLHRYGHRMPSSFGPGRSDRAGQFLALHGGPGPLLLANAWDAGTAKVLASLGFRALATTSAGHAATLGRRDGAVTRDEAIAHAAVLVSATDLPVSADLEDGFADDPDGTAETVRLAVDAGLAGCSVEDWSRTRGEILDLGLARAKVEAAAEAAHGGNGRLVLTGRAENHFRGITDLADTITRLQAYQEAGADVLYAPGLADAEDIRRVVESVDRPVNVLARPGLPSVSELGRIGVRRVSVGAAFSRVAYGALATAARELLDAGSYGFWTQAGEATALWAAFDS